jgi:hypothetical protein
MTQQPRRQQWQQQPTALTPSLLTKGEDHRNAAEMTSSPPPPLLIPLALAESHARPGDLDRSKVASRIINPSVACRHIFGGGR